MKTFKQLQEEVLRYFDLANEASDDPFGEDVGMAKAAVNQANQNRSTEDNWKFMLSPVRTLTLVSGTQEYVLPFADFRKFWYVWSTTKNQFVISAPMREIPYSDVDFDNQRQATRNLFDFNGFSPVAYQPATAATLSLTSTETETNNPFLYIEGEDSNGLQINEELAVDDTTVQSFAKITYVAKSGTFLGTVTLTEDGGPTNILILTDEEYGKQYPIVKFYNIPSESDTLTYRYFRTPRVLTREHDIPNIPFPACNVLVWDALLHLATFHELDSESVNIWRNSQMECLTNLYGFKMEGDVVGGIGEYINGEQDMPWR